MPEQVTAEECLSYQQGDGSRLGSFPSEASLSITYDNGSENTEHEAVNKALGTDSYFCAPYHRWEGAVESINGLIRRYFGERERILPKRAKLTVSTIARRRQLNMRNTEPKLAETVP